MQQPQLAPAVTPFLLLHALPVRAEETKFKGVVSVCWTLGCVSFAYDMFMFDPSIPKEPALQTLISTPRFGNPDFLLFIIFPAFGLREKARKESSLCALLF